MANALDSLKRVKEQLGQNYTSFQLLSVLDQLLWKSMWPILRTTDYFDRVLANVIGWSATNPRRKLSSLPKERFNTYAMAYLAADTPKIKFRILKKMRIERNVLFYVVGRFLEIMQDVPPARPSQRIANALAVFDYEGLWFAARESSYWHQRSIEFKGMIMEKYMRFVMMEAQMFHKQQRDHNPHLNFDIEDLAQNFSLAVNKAIDKCDAQQGTLTSYIKNWIKDAKGNPQLRGEYGIAYTIPASQRRLMAQSTNNKAVNISVSIDDEELQGLRSESNIEEEYERKRTIDLVRMLAKRADPTGISRMFLGIGEILLPEELRQLETQVSN
jgi:hypothetical protein